MGNVSAVTSDVVVCLNDDVGADTGATCFNLRIRRGIALRGSVMPFSLPSSAVMD